MSYNNNYYGGYNPYATYPYQNPYQGNYGMQQQYQQQYQQQVQNFIPMYYVQGIEGAKAYNMQPNSTVLLKDSDSNLLFMKTSDSQCKCVLERFKMVKDEEVNQETKGSNFNVSTLVTKQDLEAFKSQIVTLLKGGVSDDEK